MEHFNEKGTQIFEHLGDEWTNALHTARSLGYTIKEIPFLGLLKLTKEGLAIEVSDQKNGYLSVHVLSPFRWHEFFSVQTHGRDFIHKISERLHEILFLFEEEDNSWFEKVSFRNAISGKVANFNELTLKQIKQIDQEQLNLLEKTLDSIYTALNESDI